MRLIGLLSWFEEPAAWLAACVTSMSRCGLDHLVAVDGAYGLLEQGSPRSGLEQHDTLSNVCASLGIGLTLHVPASVWVDNEVGKRTAMFELADRIAEPGDWLWVMDADQRALAPFDLKSPLGDTTLDVAETMFVEPDPKIEIPSRFPLRNVFRAGLGLRCVDNHYTYLTADGRMLWGNQGSSRKLEQAVDLLNLEIEHRTYYRPKERHQRQYRYYERRTTTGIENPACDVCGKPRSASQSVPYDWESVPMSSSVCASWLNACEECFDKATRRSEQQLRRLTRPLIEQLNDPCPCKSGKRWHECHSKGVTLDDVQITKGKVPA